MMYRVLKKQYNSKLCFVCGMENHAGLHTIFYELEQDRLLGLFRGADIHQSYPKRMHGGIISALLDETIGRAIQINHLNLWGVTVELTIRYHQPVPIEQTLYAVGWIQNEKSRLFEGEGYLCDPTGVIYATAHGKYIKQDVAAIVKDNDFVEGEWIHLVDDEMPEGFDLPK